MSRSGPCKIVCSAQWCQDAQTQFLVRPLAGSFAPMFQTCVLWNSIGILLSWLCSKYMQFSSWHFVVLNRLVVIWLRQKESAHLMLNKQSWCVLCNECLLLLFPSYRLQNLNLGENGSKPMWLSWSSCWHCLDIHVMCNLHGTWKRKLYYWKS